jgi:hypothetical protein
MRRIVVAVVTVASVVVPALAVPAVSSANQTNASCEGATHGSFANVNGNSGEWLGPDGGAFDHGTFTGQSGWPAPGYNNSHVVCP